MYLLNCLIYAAAIFVCTTDISGDLLGCSCVFTTMFWFGAVVDETLDRIIPSFKIILLVVRLLEATLLSVMLLVAAVINFGRQQRTVTVTSR